MKSSSFIVLLVCTIHLQAAAANQLFHGICSLPTEAQFQQFVRFKGKTLGCSSKYSHNCGETYCATSRNVCDEFLYASMLIRSVVKPRMYGSQIKKYDRFKKSIRKCNAFMIEFF